MSVIDLRDQRDPAEGIIRIIDAAARAKTSQVNFEKELMLDAIKRKRDLEDKKSELEMEQKSWINAISPQAFENNVQSSVSPNTGIATNQTSKNIGSNPLSTPWSGISQNESSQPPMTPLAGYDNNNQPPMSIRPTSQPIQQEQQSGNIQGNLSNIAQSNEVIKIDGVTPITPAQIIFARKGRPQPKDIAYLGAYNNLRQGNASEGDKSIIRDYMGIKEQKDPNALTPSERTFKKKQFSEFAKSYADNELGTKLADEAMAVAGDIPQGFLGNVQLSYIKNMDPKNPILGKWQKVKGILTDTTLLKSMETKGAISDKEMKEFRTAAANDDLASMPRIVEALTTYKRKVEADNNGLVNSFYVNFGEDPRDLLPKNLMSNAGSVQDNTPSFVSEQEAEAANLPSGTEIIINGRRARVN